MPGKPHLGFNAIINALPASTPFIAPETMERQRGRPFTGRLGANESLFGPSQRALAAMRAAVTDIALYGDPENFELREAIAEREGVDRDQIVMGSGIDDLLGTLVRVLLNPGEVAVTSLGCYPTVTYHLAGYGAHTEVVPFTAYHNDLDGLARAAQQTGARVTYLANPDNPTGSWFDGTEVDALLKRLPENCALLLDEAYTEFAPASCREDIPTNDPRLIRLRTFSKAYGMAGARIGYAIAPLEVARMCEKIRLHFGVNRIAQAGALAALRDQEYLTTVIQEVAQGRAEYTALARELGLMALPSATNFVAMETGSTEKARMVVRELAERDIFIRTPATGLTSLVRVSVGDVRRRELFARAFRDVCAITEPLSPAP